MEQDEHAGMHSKLECPRGKSVQAEPVRQKLVLATLVCPNRHRHSGRFHVVNTSSAQQEYLKCQQPHEHLLFQLSLTSCSTTGPVDVKVQMLIHEQRQHWRKKLHEMLYE